MVARLQDFHTCLRNKKRIPTCGGSTLALRLTGYHIALICFLGVPVALIITKLSVLDYAYRDLLPRTRYEVQVTLDMEAFGDEVTARTWLPVGNARQTITNEVQESGIFGLDLETSASGKQAVWTTPQLNGASQIQVSFEAQAEAVSFTFEPSMALPTEYPPSVTPYLQPSAAIQSNHPRILGRAEELVGTQDALEPLLRTCFNHVHGLGKRPFKGLTDALTTLKLGEGSCNGKSRLMVALLRNRGIPARLVGGLIMESGSKRTSHQWVEVYVSGFWVPFDPLNGHFASIPANYLELYKGDHFLFSHSTNMGFDYLFSVRKKLVSNPRLADRLGQSNWNSYQMWQAFERAGIPLGLLKIILLLPLGAMVVAIARNVIGLKTFGVFLPALIAVSASSTGLGWGLLAFVLVIMLVSLMHFPLEKLGLLYTPKLVILLVTVVIAFIALSIVGIQLDYTDLAYITLFPVVVITITAERFARTVMEDGFVDALKVTAQTLVVVVMAYLAMNSRTMEALFLAFPELFLIIIGAMLLLGRWMGLRLTEYHRFRWLA